MAWGSEYSFSVDFVVLWFVPSRVIWLMGRFGGCCCFDCFWVDAWFISSWCYSHFLRVSTYFHGLFGTYKILRKCCRRSPTQTSFGQSDIKVVGGQGEKMTLLTALFFIYSAVYDPHPGPGILIVSTIEGCWWLRYFSVIYWVWVSQVFYDIRYEGMSPPAMRLTNSRRWCPSTFQVYSSLSISIYRGSQWKLESWEYPDCSVFRIGRWRSG